MHSLGRTLFAFALLHSVLQGQICLLLCLLTSYFSIPVPYNEKNIFFWVLVLEGLVGLHRTVQLHLHQGIDFDYCDIEWFALETNRSFCF